MKNNNLSKLFKAIFAVGILTTVIACGKKNDNNNAQVNAFQMGCNDCGDITGLTFFTADSQDYYRFLRINWNFSGQNPNNGQVIPQASPQPNNYSNSPAQNYTGKVSAIGQITVSTPVNFGFCQIPQGQYTFGTQIVGRWDAGNVTNLRITTTGGPVSMTMILTQGYAVNSSYQYNTYGRVAGSLTIEAVNGYNCQNVTIGLQ